MPLTVGQSLSFYEILGPLGAGGMGEVYRAKDTRLEREVAIKVLPEEFAADAQRLRRFEREAKALAALKHAGIVTIHSIEKERGLHFLVMEVADGETLDRRIPHDGMPLPQLLRIAIDLVTAVGVAHQAGLTHRDLKPQNIVVDGEGAVKVLDFGLAKAARPGVVTGASDLTGAGQVLGTLAYMSPEQIEGKRVGPTSDVFSLGLLLHEIATGKKPFSGDSPASLLASTLRESPAAVHEERPELPGELGRIVLKCLEKDPARRYPSCADLRVDLERLRDSKEPATSPRRASMLPMAVGAFVALVAGAALLRTMFFGGDGPVVIRSLAVLPLENLSIDANGLVLADGMTDSLITELGTIGVDRVISRRSVMRYRESEMTLPDIAEELEVDALIEGSVQRSNDQILIAARLIHGTSDRLLWSQQYTRDQRDVLALQREIAAAIAAEIQIQLSDAAKPVSPARSVDPEAHHAYLLGRQAAEERTEEGLREAERSFQKAIDIDPDYAAAYAGLAHTLVLMGGYSVAPSATVMPRAIAAADEALELDENQPQAHAARGIAVLMYEHDLASAEESLRRAIACNANNHTAHHWYALIFGMRGQGDEAVASIRRACEIDPFSQQVRIDLSIHLQHAGRHAEALIEAERTLERFPGYYRAYVELGSLYVLDDRLDEGVELLEEACGFVRIPITLARLGVAYCRAGRDADARALLAELEETSGDAAPTMTALLLAALGDGEAATARLSDAYEQRDAILPMMPMFPLSDPLLQLPYYAEIRARIRAPR